MGAKPKMVCPTHDIKLLAKSTQYGMRYDCPHEGCDVMCWAGKTSTPANQATRDARKVAHAHFDVLWKSGQYKRGTLYKQLAEHFGITQEKCHIGMFNIDQCRKVLEFVQLLFNKSNGK